MKEKENSERATEGKERSMFNNKIKVASINGFENMYQRPTGWVIISFV